MKLPIKYSEVNLIERREAREEYIRRQKGKCHYCDAFLHDQASKEVIDADINEVLFPDNFFNHPIHLHHDHDTDLTIGVVHARCNAYLWQYLGE